MRICLPILFVALLEILFLCDGILRKAKQDMPMASKQQFISHSNVSARINYLRTETFTGPLALKVPSKVSHPEVSLASLSPNFKMQGIAGTSNAGYSGDNGPATSAEIIAYFPFVDFSGNIYFGDGSYRIRKVTSAGIISRFGGTGPASTSGVSGPIGSVSFNSVWSIVGDTGGTALYISDQFYVWKYVFSTGIATVFAQSTNLGQEYSGDGGFATSAQLRGPVGLWLTTSGVLYICDVGNHRIRKIASDNIITTVAGSGGGGFSGDGGPAVSALLPNPYGVYMDTNGRLFIADYANYRIRLVDTNNIISTFAGTGTNTIPVDNIPALSANIHPPNDVKGDLAGNIYISQWGYCVLQMVNTNNIISTLFGNNNCGFSAGVSQPSSPIGPPYGIWVDSLSNIYFSDYNSIRRSIDLSPTSQPSAQPTG
jgi:hypothetical protein